MKLIIKTVFPAIAVAVLASCGGENLDSSIASQAESEDGSDSSTLAVSAKALSAACTSFYAARPGFVLSTTNNVDPIATLAKPGKGTAYEEPAYGTCMTRATAYTNDFSSSYPSGAPTPVFARNDYSRRQAFNSDSTKYLIADSSGFWHVYDASTFGRIKTVPGLAGDAEPYWHPTDPNVLFYLPSNGIGMQIQQVNVSTNATSTIANLSVRLKARWPDAMAAHTRSEGSPSADGRYWCLLVDGPDWNARGIVTWDRTTDTILAMRDLTERPDHVSMSPSGNYCVVSNYSSTGVVVYNRDLTNPRKIANLGEHSDIALNSAGQDVFVSIDYQAGAGDIFMVNLVSGTRTNLVPTYLSGTATAVHFSGKSYSIPGWVLVSTYADGGGARQWLHRKVFALELASTARVKNIAFHRSAYNGYWTEPHASVNKDFTKILFNSNWGNGSPTDVDAYMAMLPTGAVTSTTTPPPQTPFIATLISSSFVGTSANYVVSTSRSADCRAATAPGQSFASLTINIPQDAAGTTHTRSWTTSSTASTTVYAVCKDKGSSATYQVSIPLTQSSSGPFQVAVTTSSFYGYDASYTLSTSQAASCRHATESGVPYAALYTNLTASTDKLTHSRSWAMGGTASTTVYAVCKADVGTAEKEVTVALVQGSTTGGSVPFAITVLSATRSGYDVNYSVGTNRAANCRTSWASGHPYVSLYSGMTKSSDGMTHTKADTLGTAAPTTVYAVCQTEDGAEELEKAVALP